MKPERYSPPYFYSGLYEEEQLKSDVDVALMNSLSNWVISNNTFEPNKNHQLVALETDAFVVLQ